MPPAVAQRTQQIPCVLLGPVAQLHASTVGRTYDSNPGCENFLYIIKKVCRPAGGPRAVLGRRGLRIPSSKSIGASINAIRALDFAGEVRVQKLTLKGVQMKDVRFTFDGDIDGG